MDQLEEKAIGQMRMQLNNVFAPFKMYGLDIFIPQAKEEVINLAIQLHMRLMGEETPILYRGGIWHSREGV